MEVSMRSPRNMETTEMKLSLRVKLDPSMSPAWVDVMYHVQLWPGRHADE